ncbi:MULTISPECIES: helix-turn-helix transcriptional regulator [unclassified Streptomyces]|uniref:helix-turn-helix transcriptional regulator n=1 Tax=unclassified Streptomyces TaxID=2593676 RepID=UPI0028C50109|nr:AAA family ATPase [Streptomyces sp. AM2-3-1]WNO62443.1 AAA family ATPase [Streptomyces sp. AM2-3-1]WNO69503.1 AAA family ATPase [Streptomyces sp. AM2-3-1]WTE57410.1 AAA family ATPase [Streptomyces sp. NBC_01617]
MTGTHCPPRGTADRLIGRDRDLQQIRDLLGLGAAGGALLLSGEAGVGKTAVLDALAETARADGTRVLRAGGVQFEANCSYSGLNQVLFPFQDALGELQAPFRDALRVALGFESGPPPQRLMVSNAVLLLLSTVAAGDPLLLVIDDLPWLDRASAAVLGFVARRATGIRVSFLATSRSGSQSLHDSGVLPEFRLQPLDEASADHLVSTRFPDLVASARRRLLTVAHGNPLALLELPSALPAMRGPAGEVPAVLPLSRRLETVFGSRITSLPHPSQRLLLLAALEGVGDLGVLQAATRQANDGYHLDDLAPAERDQLVHIDEEARRLRFRHPLIRSAVVENSTSGERRAVHAALAHVLVDQPERRAWHLGEATLEPDENVAALLEHAARITLHRGDAANSMRTLIRSADLTPPGPDRARRLAEAAYVGAESTGSLPSAQKLLDDARHTTPGPHSCLHSAAAAALLLLNGDGDVDTAHGLLVAAIDTGTHAYDANDKTLVDALHTLALICFFGARHDLWQPYHRALEKLTPTVPPVLSALGKTFSDPARTGAAASEELDALIAELAGVTDPVQITRAGTAALYLDRLGDIREAAWQVVRMGRDGGPARRYMSGLIHLCLDDYLTGRWDEATQLADEGIQLCETHGYTAFVWYFQYIQAILAAARGQADQADATAEQIIHRAQRQRADCAAHYAHHAAAVAALGRGDFTDAYEHAHAISPAGNLASHTPHALWVTMDLVEAAIRTGRRTEAAAHAHAMREADIAKISSRHALLTEACAALATTDDDEALTLFTKALATTGAERWPFDYARVQLAHGERLRRTRATTESRTPLSAALTTFEHLGARPWAERAETELRAAGTSKRHNTTPTTHTLTPQELEIARLAASGLTNKQIAQRLYLSHRTIGAHLYQIYPKLGITSRTMLRDTLEP